MLPDAADASNTIMGGKGVDTDFAESMLKFRSNCRMAGLLRMKMRPFVAVSAKIPRNFSTFYSTRIVNLEPMSCET